MTIYYMTSDDMIDELIATQANPGVKILDYGYQISNKQWFMSVEILDNEVIL